MFQSQPLPESFKEIIDEIPYLWNILENSKTYLAGGFLRTLVSTDEVLSPRNTDIDLFFGFPELFEGVKEYFQATPAFKKVYQCPENKLTTFVHAQTGWKYQCIAVDFYDTLTELVESFDFTVTCFGTDGENLVSHVDALRDTVDKRLRWNKITYPASSLRRLTKYVRKGYSMREEEYQEFVTKIWEHDWNIKDEKLVYVD